MMDGVIDGMIVGLSIEVIVGEKLIIIVGVFDVYVYYICF